MMNLTLNKLGRKEGRKDGWKKGKMEGRKEGPTTMLSLELGLGCEQKNPTIKWLQQCGFLPSHSQSQKVVPEEDAGFCSLRPQGPGPFQLTLDHPSYSPCSPGPSSAETAQEPGAEAHSLYFTASRRTALMRARTGGNQAVSICHNNAGN